MTLEYTHVKRDIRAVVVDGPDEDDLPDKLRAQGIVTFTPVIRKGDTFQYDGPDGLVTMVPKPIEARISDGIIFHRGREGVKLLAGGPGMNPNAVRWRARFEHMQAGGWSFTLRDVTFDAVPGGEVDLTLAAPVAGTPGEGIVRGPSGTSIQDVHVEGAELVITAIDDDGVRELNRIPLDDVVASTAEAAAGRAADGVRQRVKVDADRASGSAEQASAAAEQSAEDRRQTGEDREAAEGWAGQSRDAATLAITAAATTSQYVGDGFPEGRVAAPVGAIYTDRQATAGAVRWIKTQGTGATGWKVQHGDTGWRNITASGQVISGQIFVRRAGTNVELAFVEVVHDPNAAALKSLNIPGTGSGQNRYVTFSAVNHASLNNPVHFRFRLLRTSAHDYVLPTGVDLSRGISGALAWNTDDPWPVTLPGVPH